MKEIINDCVDCDRPSHCNICSKRHAVLYYCDRCGDFIQDELKYYEGMELCDVCYGDLRGEEI